jgi:carboxyl-terminal processing protease
MTTDQSRMSGNAVHHRSWMARSLKIAFALAASIACSVAVGGQLDPSFAGVWAQRGYGKILHLSTTRLVTYDVTDISCIRLDDQPLAVAAREFDRVERTSKGFTLFEVGGVTRYEFENLPKLPQRCRGAAGTQRVRDPEVNFWVLWHALREHYAFFHLRKVNWNEMYQRFRPGISAASSDDDLFLTFSGMLEPLNDGHVELTAGDREFSGGTDGELLELWKSIVGSPKGYEAAVRKHIVEYALKGQAKTAAGGTLIYGWAAPGVGYINTMSMEVPSDSGTELPLPRQLQVIEQAMTQIMRDLGGARALIVDARFNDGGYDAVALKIMGSFTREPRLAFAKKAVEGEAYTPTQEVYFQPSGANQFTGPIFYLQSGTTVSAAEVFSLAMLALPNVTSIGTRTYGVLSDQLDKQLPNGWTVTLSNEVYLAVDGKLYEGCGIPPDVSLEVGNIRDFQARLRLDVDRALSLAGVR